MRTFATRLYLLAEGEQVESDGTAAARSLYVAYLVLERLDLSGAAPGAVAGAAAGRALAELHRTAAATHGTYGRRGRPASAGRWAGADTVRSTGATGRASAGLQPHSAPDRAA